MSKPLVVLSRASRALLRRNSAKDLLVVVVLTIVSISHQLGAQRRDAPQSKASTSGRGSTSVRVELASVLMQSKRYAEAERGYRARSAGGPAELKKRQSESFARSSDRDRRTDPSRRCCDRCARR